jgi:hypothetical protein
MAVPKGGSSCANCALYSASAGKFGICLSPHYHQFYGTVLIPCPPDSFCSDWYEPAGGFRLPRC